LQSEKENEVDIISVENVTTRFNRIDDFQIIETEVTELLEKLKEIDPYYLKKVF
jgi:hypothetical protein